MSWFEDLTPYTYSHAETTSPTTLNVGWLERGHEFPTGEVPAAFVARLAQLAEHAVTHATRGMHHCDLCPPSDDEEPPSGHAELRRGAPVRDNLHRRGPRPGWMRGGASGTSLDRFDARHTVRQPI